MTDLTFIRLRNALAAVMFSCVFAFNSFGQTPARQPQSEANYEVVLQVLSASNDAGDKSAAAVPQPLAGVVKKLKSMYSFANYRLNLTYLQRVADAGSLDFKGVLREGNEDVYAPVFSDFAFARLAGAPDAGERNMISIQNFRFGQRVPIKTAVSTDDAGGKPHSILNYEQIGMSMRQINLPLDAPTIIGNLSATKPDELSFLILTVRRTEQ